MGNHGVTNKGREADKGPPLAIDTPQAEFWIAGKPRGLNRNGAYKSRLSEILLRTLRMLGNPPVNACLCIRGQRQRSDRLRPQPLSPATPSLLFPQATQGPAPWTHALQASRSPGAPRPPWAECRTSASSWASGCSPGDYGVSQALGFVVAFRGVPGLLGIPP